MVGLWALESSPVLEPGDSACASQNDAQGSLGKQLVHQVLG